MDIPQETTLLAKVFWSAAIVVGLSAIAERVSTRMAGILAGAPQNAVLIYFFVGRDMGTAYVVESVPYAIAAFTATLAFVIGYYWSSLWFTRHTAMASSVIGVAAFVVFAWVLDGVLFTLASAFLLTLCSSAAALWHFRKIRNVPVDNPVRFTARIVLLRGGLAATAVVVLIYLAESLGSRWAGLLTGFPAILLPTLVIIHLTYGTASTHTMIRSFPIGLGSIVLYILSVPLTFPHFGVLGGTAASLALSFVYLTMVMIWRKGRVVEAK